MSLLEPSMNQSDHLTTCIACLVLAFLRSWALTLVILSAVPLLMFIQALSQRFASPLLTHEQTGISATIIDHAIATIKAFNATKMENKRAKDSFVRLEVAAKRLNGVWGATSGIAQFIMMSMFVQGFWFGSKLQLSLSARASAKPATSWLSSGPASSQRAICRCAFTSSSPLLKANLRVYRCSAPPHV